MSELCGTTIVLQVKQSAQSASGGSYLVQFQADIAIRAERSIEVIIETVYANDPQQADVEAARSAIQKGCAEVLESARYGARVAVNDLVIHPVDFKPDKYARWTAMELQRRLDDLAVNDS